MLKVCLLGLGRTGAVVAEQLLNAPDFELTSVIAKPDSSKADRSLAAVLKRPTELVIAAADELRQEIKAKKFKVAIDFTTPEATLKNARILAENGIHMVIGTTGFNNSQLYELKQLVQQYKVGLVYAPNIAVGINLLLSIVKTVTRLIPYYDIEITESCHRDKNGIPSGTALKIANEVAQIKQQSSARHGEGCDGGHAKKSAGVIGVHSSQPTGLVGMHQVLFAGEADELEITHRSYSRAIYAEGALKAAAFVAGIKGFFHMEDVLLAERLERDLRVEANRLFLNFN